MRTTGGWAFFTFTKIPTPLNANPPYVSAPSKRAFVGGLRFVGVSPLQSLIKSISLGGLIPTYISELTSGGLAFFTFPKILTPLNANPPYVSAPSKRAFVGGLRFVGVSPLQSLIKSISLGGLIPTYISELTSGGLAFFTFPKIPTPLNANPPYVSAPP
jgi:hypothetical protein